MLEVAPESEVEVEVEVKVGGASALTSSTAVTVAVDVEVVEVVGGAVSAAKPNRRSMVARLARASARLTPSPCNRNCRLRTMASVISSCMNGDASPTKHTMLGRLRATAVAPRTFGPGGLGAMGLGVASARVLACLGGRDLTPLGTVLGTGERGRAAALAATVAAATDERGDAAEREVDSAGPPGDDAAGVGAGGGSEVVAEDAIEGEEDDVVVEVVLAAADGAGADGDGVGGASVVAAARRAGGSS